MARTQVPGSQIADGANGVNLTVDVTGVLPVANGGTGASSIPTWNQNTTGTASNVTGTVAVANGGTGNATNTLNGILLGNGTGALQNVAPSTAGYILGTDGSTWQAQPLTRVTSITSSATPTLNTDTTDQLNITALAVAITSMTSGLAGTPRDGQKVMVRIKDNGTARAIAWGTSFVSSGVATLLATTVISKTHLIGLMYDAAATKWVCIAVDATGY